jgi:hypothetical protein
VDRIGYLTRKERGILLWMLLIPRLRGPFSCTTCREGVIGDLQGCASSNEARLCNFVERLLVLLQEKYQQLQKLETTPILHPPFPALYQKGRNRSYTAPNMFAPRVRSAFRPVSRQASQCLRQQRKEAFPRPSITCQIQQRRYQSNPTFFGNSKILFKAYPYSVSTAVFWCVPIMSR